MRVRYFGLLLLIAVGIVPVVSAGLWIVNRAQDTCPSGQGLLGTTSSGTPRQGRSCP